MQQGQGFPHGVAVRERTEILAFSMLSATVRCQTRVSIAAEKDERIGFVIAQQHVVTRLIQLDVVMLQQQRFGLCVGHSDIDLLDLGDQRLSFAGSKIAAEIAGKSLFEIFRFSDIDNRPASVIHPVDARLAGNGFQESTGFKHITH